MRVRTYAELARIPTIEERFEYLTLKGDVGAKTFGFERFLNQDFYRSYEWKRVRQIVLARDNGCDLGIEEYPVHVRPIIHHMNPMTVDDIESADEKILNPEFLITTSHNTHNAIHYGVGELVIPRVVERRPGDTKLW